MARIKASFWENPGLAIANQSFNQDYGLDGVYGM
jgi:hypothetical protein